MMYQLLILIHFLKKEQNLSTVHLKIKIKVLYMLISFSQNLQCNKYCYKWPIL